MGAESTRKTDLIDRIGSAIGSPLIASVVAIISAAGTVSGWVAHSSDLKDVLLGGSFLVNVVVVASLMSVRGAYLRLRRANSDQMDDPVFYELVREPIERELLSEYQDIADGLIQVYGSKVRKTADLFLAALSDSRNSERRIRAVDLTTNPALLRTRTPYLEANRRFIVAGGAIDRLFVCRREHLIDELFAKEFLALVDEHKASGVRPGLAVREALRAEQAVDYIVFGTGVVLIEEEQGDQDYTVGRSWARFKGTAGWIATFESVWGASDATSPAMLRLQSYETIVRAMIAGGTWEPKRILECLSAV